MITGSVNADFEPIIPISIYDLNGKIYVTVQGENEIWESKRHG